MQLLFRYWEEIARSETSVGWTQVTSLL